MNDYPVIVQPRHRQPTDRRDERARADPVLVSGTLSPKQSLPVGRPTTNTIVPESDAARESSARFGLGGVTLASVANAQGA